MASQRHTLVVPTLTLEDAVKAKMNSCRISLGVSGAVVSVSNR